MFWWGCMPVLRVFFQFWYSLQHEWYVLRHLLPTRLLRTSLLFIDFWKREWAKQKFNVWFCFFAKLKLELKLKLNQKKYKIKNFNLLKLKNASARVNLYGLMVRFSFARDCGSIPHKDSTVSMFFIIFSLWIFISTYLQ